MAESWAGGLERGLLKGLQIGSMFEEGRARKEASKAREEKGKLAERQEKRQILTSEMNQIVQVLKSKLWKEFDPYQKKNIYDKYKELMGKFMPGYTLPDLDVTKFGEGAATAVRQAMTDGLATVNSKQTTEEKQLDMMGHWQKLKNNPEAWAVLKGSFDKHKEERVASDKYQFDSDVTTMKEFMQGEGGRGFNFAGSGTQVDPRHTVPAQLRNVSDRVRAVIGRGLKDAQYGGNVVNAANIELGKKTLEPGDEKHKTLMDPNFGVDLKKSLGMLRLIRSGETKDKNGKPLPTEREIRDKMISTYRHLRGELDAMLSESGSKEQMAELIIKLLTSQRK